VSDAGSATASANEAAMIGESRENKNGAEVLKKKSIFLAKRGKRPFRALIVACKGLPHG